ncbi:MAG TPA: serine/threonine-protein kinase [Planctomycetota bacterium]
MRRIFMAGIPCSFGFRTGPLEHAGRACVRSRFRNNRAAIAFVEAATMTRMEAERWRRVRAVLEPLLARSEAERAEFLSRECAGDHELRAEVEALLAVDASEPRFEPPGAGDWLCAVPVAGRRVGDYEIERELGRGGMGTVYLARREADGFVQRVALKLVRRGLEDAETIRRFRTERAVLAALQHERIARFLDGGATPDGQPWYAMEYVDGEPIDRWCDGQELGTRARVALFLEVCAAVQHAHAKLVVHRDLKPANLLVARDGHVKLLDFGIAKLLESDAAETLTGRRALTPAYASPEQLRGEPITIASDVYALGIVLYELLTGVRPFPTPNALAARAEPERPSTVVLRSPDPGIVRGGSGERLARELRGDLDTIALKALHVDPTRRYATVAALADDLARHLAGRIVLARPDTASYRVRTFVRRNRLAVTLAAIALTALVAGLAGTLSMYVEASAQAKLARERLDDVQDARTAEARAREDTEQRFADVRQLASKFLFEFHDLIADLPGTTAARELSTSTGLAYLDLLARERGDEPGLRLDLARGYRRIADLQYSTRAASRTDLAGALETLERARALLDELGGEGSIDPGVQFELGSLYGERSSLLKNLGRNEEAATDLERSASILTALSAEGFDPGELAAPLAKALLYRGYAAQGRGALDEARTDMTRALEWARRVATDEDPEGRRAYAVLKSRSALAGLALAAGDARAALEEKTAIAAEMDQLVEQHPVHLGFRRAAAECERDIAMSLIEGGRQAEAIAHADLAAAHLRELARFDPSDGMIRNRLADADKVAGMARHQAGRPGEAVACFRTARVWLEGQRASHPEDDNTRKDLGGVLCYEGLAEMASGATEDGRAHARLGLELLAAGTGGLSTRASHRANYGKMLVWVARQSGETYERRIECLEEALTVLDAARADFDAQRGEGDLLPRDEQTLERCDKLTDLALSELEKLTTPP